MAQIFVLNQKLLSLGGDLWIEDDQGNHAFEVAGRVLSLHDTHVLQDLQGQPLFEISRSLAHIHRTFEIKRGDQVVATIQEALINLLGDHFTVTLADGSTLAVKGDWIDRNFTVTEGGRDVIAASRKFLSIRDCYGIQIAPGFDIPLALAIVVALEQMELEEHRS